MDKPLEEVGDAEEGGSRVLNFVRSDGLSRVRVCHVSFMSFKFVLDCSVGFRIGGRRQIERDGGGFGLGLRVFALGSQMTQIRLHSGSAVFSFGRELFSGFTLQCILSPDIPCVSSLRVVAPETLLGHWVEDAFEPRLRHAFRL